MLAKYNIEFATNGTGHELINHHLTDDPVACEVFLTDLLDRRIKIRRLTHDGVELPRPEFDRMIKTAAGMMAARHVCHSLGIDSAEVRHRFGLPG